MELKSRIVGYDLNKKTVTFSFQDMDISKYIDKDLRLSMKVWREKRSLNANAYFYVLIDKLADVMRTSKPFMHNLMLRKYGQVEKIDNKPIWIILPETEEVAKKIDEDEEIHLKPTSELREGKDGRMYRTYLLLKGSHQFDTREMSILLDGVIADCHENNISTITPEEIERMKSLWNIDIDTINQ